jgi:hypothetical protein
LWRDLRSTGILPMSGMGFQPMDHRQDVDATKPHGQDARDTHGRDAHATERPPGVTTNEHRLGNGRVISDKTAREVLTADGIGPDFAFSSNDPNVALDYIHRRDGEVDIYFVANRSPRPVQATCTFRVAGKQPELWDPITGHIRSVPVRASEETPDGATANEHTSVLLDFAPCGSTFVVFRESDDRVPSAGSAPDLRNVTMRYEVPGPWKVRFDPNWGGPGLVEFPQLVSWTQRPEEGIRFYSGTARYRRVFDLPKSLQDSRGTLVLDLGNLRELAEVNLNDQSLGILWAPPFGVDVTDVIQPTGNRLEINVVNFWPNRIIGDQSLPPEKRLTQTNIRKLTKDTPLIESGLLGPVTIGIVTD